MELNKITIKQVLLFIQESVQEHAQQMKLNNDKLEEIMTSMPPSNARTAKLREIYEMNQEISKKNYELNALHISILGLIRNKKEEFAEFLNNGMLVNQNIPTRTKIEKLNEELGNSKKKSYEYADSVLKSVASSLGNIDEAFKLTIDGKIELDTFHPYASNNEFLDKLLKYYESKEQFEQCVVISKLKSSVKN